MAGYPRKTQDTPLEDNLSFENAGLVAKARRPNILYGHMRVFFSKKGLHMGCYGEGLE